MHINQSANLILAYISKRIISSNLRLLLVSSIASLAFVLFLSIFFSSRWGSNDDIGMSMVAHGYGLAAFGSPNLIYSNVIWGYLVRSIPEISGILGYSISTLILMVVVGSTIIYGLLRLGVTYVACLSAFVLIMVRYVIFPDFTVNAGLLMVGGLILWRMYTQNGNTMALIVGCFLAFFSYLVRSQEFLLVLLVSLPLLQWRIFFIRRAAKISVFILAFMIMLSAIIDHQAYQGDEWKKFKQSAPVLSSLVDFGAGPLLMKRPDILSRYGYSVNDIHLIYSWFFVDEKIFNVIVLQNMLTALGPLPAQAGALENAWIGVKSLWAPKLLPLMIVALFLSVLLPSRRLTISWIFCISAVFLLGLLGRPGILRVYVPLLSLFIVFALLNYKGHSWRYQAAVFSLVVAAGLLTGHVVSESTKLRATDEKIRQGLLGLPRETIYNWGGFPFEAVYKIFDASSPVTSYPIYSLGAFTFAPFSNTFVDQKMGRSLPDLIVQESGVPMLIDSGLFPLLETYCNERLHGHLKNISTKKYNSIELNRFRCDSNP